jgi:tetratricopeptide (TPR) repeat protein
MSRRDDLKKQIDIHRRRLQKLEEQQAFRGLDTPAHILIEIEDIKAKIEELRAELKVLEDGEAESQIHPFELAEDAKPKQRAQIYLQGDFSLLSDDRQSAAIAAFAAVMGISSQEIEVYRVYEGSIVFDLGIPPNAIHRLRSLLQSNSGQLRLLKVEKVIMERESGEIEEWIIKEGKFDLVTPSRPATSNRIHRKPPKTNLLTVFDQRGQRVDTQINVAGDYIEGAGQAPPGPPLQRPPRVDHFTGREKELKALLAQLQPGQVVTLCGPGGVGKTALVAEAIWTLAPGDVPPERFPDGIIFHTFYNQPQAALALEAIARACGEEPKPSPRDAASRALSGRTALLILDGTENADDLGAVLAVRGKCGALITSRRHTDAPGDWEDVEPLPNPQAVQLLQAWGGARAADEAAAQRICTLVGALPLAVYLAGRYMAQRGQEAAEYLEWLEKTPLVALHFGDRQRESAQVLMERSAAQLSQSARAALGVAGILALASFDRAAVAAALEVSVPAAGRALGELVDYGLLLRDEQGRYQTSHALIHTYARRRLAPPEEMIERLAAYYDAFAREQRELGLAGYARLDAERPHLMGVLERCTEQESWEAARSLVWAVDDYLDMRGYWVKWVTALQAGLAAARGLEHRRDEGVFLGKLGNAYYALGEVRRAIEFYDQALAIARKIGDRPAEGVDLGNLGIAYRALGEQRRAIEFYDQALAIAREIGDRRNEGTWLGNLGNAYHALERQRRAIEFYDQALAIAREIGDRRNEGVFLGNLGNAYYALGEPRRAIEFYDQALAIAREIGDRRGEGNHLGNLGNAYNDLGEARRAIEYYDQALTIAREIGDRRAEGADLGNLGNAYRALEEPRRAIEFYDQALAISREIGDRHSEGTWLGGLGLAYARLGEARRAIEFYDQALAIARKIGDRRGEGNHLGNLGLAYALLGEARRAIEFYDQALAISREIGDRRGEGNHLGNLGNAYYLLGEARRAIEYLEQALAIFEEIESPYAERVRRWLADLQNSQSNPRS